MKSSEHCLALGFAAGAFASFTPFIGFHFLLAAALAFLVRGNLIASAVGTVVGNPITFPAIWLATYNVGALTLGTAPRQEVNMEGATEFSIWTDGPYSVAVNAWASLEPVLLPMCVGAVPLGLFFGVIFYALVLAGLRSLRRGPQLMRARG